MGLSLSYLHNMDNGSLLKTLWSSTRAASVRITEMIHVFVDFSIGVLNPIVVLGCLTDWLSRRPSGRNDRGLLVLLVHVAVFPLAVGWDTRLRESAGKIDSR